MRFLASILVILVFIFSTKEVFANVKPPVKEIPCLLFTNKGWVLQDSALIKKKDFPEDSKSCVQYSKEAFRKSLEMNKALEIYKKKEKIWKEKEKAHQEMEKSFKRSQEGWKEQSQLYERVVMREREQAELWKKAFIKKPQWYESPVFWFSVGVLTATAITITLVVVLPR